MLEQVQRIYVMNLTMWKEKLKRVQNLAIQPVLVWHVHVSPPSKKTIHTYVHLI